MFKRVGDIIDDQWALCAGINELKELQRAARVQGETAMPVHTPIKTEPVSLNLDAGHATSLAQEQHANTRDIESLYASEENVVIDRRDPLEQNQAVGESAEQSDVDS